MSEKGVTGQVRMRVAAIIVRDARVLMVRHEKAGRSYWMLPGGGVDFGETLAEALERELREEIGVEIKVRDLVLANDSIAPDGGRHIVNLYFSADLVSGEPRVGEDERVVEVAWQPVSALKELPMFPDFAEVLQSQIAEEGEPRYLGNLWKE